MTPSLAGRFRMMSFVVLMCLTTASWAGTPGQATPTSTLSLRGDYALGGFGQEQETTKVTTTEYETGWTLDGPYFLRSADPVEPGEKELKFIYAYEKEEDDEEHELEFVFEWGVMENLEFIFEIPAVIGDGRVEGNGDIQQIGFHVKHWSEDGWMPAFATRHLVRLPTGYHSDGVDYLGRGLLTWTLVPDKLRLEFNPWLKSVNGNREDDTRWFQWGAAVGFDFQCCENWIFIADYHNRSSEEFGSRNQQTIELGADWEFAEDQILAFATEFEVDGDENGSDFVARISYILELH